MAGRSLDEMITGIDVSEGSNTKVRIKFLAISGGCGPELTMDRSLAETLKNKLVTLLVEN